MGGFTRHSRKRAAPDAAGLWAQLHLLTCGLTADLGTAGGHGRLRVAQQTVNPLFIIKYIFIK